MTKRRSRGEGSIYWDASRQRWIAVASLGFDGRGKRIVKKGSGKTKTAAKDKLKEVLRDYEDGLAIAPSGMTVGDAMRDWVNFGNAKCTEKTRQNYASLCRTHVIPHLGAIKLRDLTATHIDHWLAGLSGDLSTRTLRLAHNCLNRAIDRAMACDKVKRNVVRLAEVPTGRPGRPSKSLTLAQAEAILDNAKGTPIYAYLVVSLLTGARTEEMRALRWKHVHLDGQPDHDPPLPPYVEVWRSVRVGGDTKTRKSRRTLALPARCVDALAALHAAQERAIPAEGPRWADHGVVFASRAGTEMDASNVRKAFRAALERVPDIDPEAWTPRELRHSFVSLLSDRGVPIEDISRLVGHSTTAVTEAVYRHQLRPVVQLGASVMDEIFGT